MNNVQMTLLQDKIEKLSMEEINTVIGFVNDRKRELRHQVVTEVRGELRKGDSVSFIARGCRWSGVVTKINRTTCVVDTGRDGREGSWKVPMTMVAVA